MIKEAIQTLVSGQSLTMEDAAAVMEEIMSGEATPAQFGAFVTALRTKGETVEEIAGLAEKINAAAEKTRTLFAFFNNHWQAYAPRNANDMKKALQLSFQDIPMSLEMTQETGDADSKNGVT